MATSSDKADIRPSPATDVASEKVQPVHNGDTQVKETETANKTEASDKMENPVPNSKSESDHNVNSDAKSGNHISENSDKMPNSKCESDNNEASKFKGTKALVDDTAKIMSSMTGAVTGESSANVERPKAGANLSGSNGKVLRKDQNASTTSTKDMETFFSNLLVGKKEQKSATSSGPKASANPGDSNGKLQGKDKSRSTCTEVDENAQTGENTNPANVLTNDRSANPSNNSKAQKNKKNEEKEKFR